jgi:hypothetical protein
MGKLFDGTQGEMKKFLEKKGYKMWVLTRFTLRKILRRLKRTEI